MAWRGWLPVACLVLLPLAACDDGGEAEPTTPPTASSAPASSGPASSTPGDTSEPTTAPPTTPSTTAGPGTSTTAVPPTTTEACPHFAGTDPVVVGFPMTLSSLVGHDIRTGGHPCFERVVLELSGEGAMPGYQVRYVADPVRLSPSDLEVDIRGDATLVLSVGAWMTTPEGDGYDGPQQIQPTNVVHILELRLIENFEGMHQWAIGLDAERPFRVTTLDDPARIVIDIRT